MPDPFIPLADFQKQVERTVDQLRGAAMVAGLEFKVDTGAPLHGPPTYEWHITVTEPEESDAD